MSELLLYLQLIVALIIVLFFIPTMHRLFEKSYHPAFRPPYTFMWKDLLALLIVGMLFSFLYAVTGGGIEDVFQKITANTLKNIVESEIERSSINLKYSVIIGAFIFGSSRLWSMYKNHHASEFVFFTTLILFSSILTICVLSSNNLTIISDTILKRNVDDISLLPFTFFVVSISILTTEMLARFGDTFVKQNPCIPYSLIRSQFEGFENYPRITSIAEMILQIESELKIIESIKEKDKKIHISWLTTNTSDQIINVLKKHNIPNDDFHLKIISHQSDKNKSSLIDFNQKIKKFANFDGSLRLFIIGNRVAFLGVQMGYHRQEENPDYIIVIREPTRIGNFISIFRSCWISN